MQYELISLLQYGLQIFQITLFFKYSYIPFDLILIFAQVQITFI